MKSSQKRYLNSLKGADNKIRFLQRLITEKNEHIKYLEDKVKNLRENIGGTDDQ